LTKSSYSLRTTVAAVAVLAAFIVAATSTGIAQGPPAAPGAQQPAAPGAPGGAPGGPGGGRAGGGGGQGRGGRGGPAVDELAAGPWEFGGGRGGRYRVTVFARGLDTPWGIAFAPNGDILVTERSGNLRVVRNGVLDSAPIGGVPAVISNPGQLGGLLDVSLHPKFAENRLVYLAYSKQHPDPAQCPDRRQTC
jgi:glucose/arabinose dehydrogenase